MDLEWTIRDTLIHDESCEGRCDHNDFTICRCDFECLEYGDCCIDYNSTCGLTSSIPNAPSETKIDPEMHSCYSVTPGESAYFVHRCPLAWNETFIRSRCDHQIDGMPVFDDSGYNFRNIFCAICHSRKISQIQPRRAVQYHSHVCHISAIFVTQHMFQKDEVGLEFEKYVEFLVGNRNRRCFDNQYNQCPILSDMSLSTYCKSYVLEICAKIDVNAYTWVKNAHCAACNELELTIGAHSQRKCQNNLGYHSSPYQHIWRFRSHKTAASVSSPTCYPGEILDTFTQTCRKISCRPGLITSHDRCFFNNDTKLYITNNWNCIKRNTLLFFRSSVKEYDTSKCLTDQLRSEWLDKVHDKEYSHLVLEDGITWTALKFSKDNGFELLRQIENTTSVENAKDVFCGVTEIETFLSCDLQSLEDFEQLSCKEEWYSGTPSDFVFVNTSQQMTLYITKDIYINVSYMIYHEHYDLESRVSTQKNVLLVCGHEVRPTFLECTLVTLNVSEFTMNANKSVLTYAGKEFTKGNFLLLVDGNAQIRFDFLVINGKTTNTDMVSILFSEPLEVICSAATCLSLIGLMGTLYFYVRFRRLRNLYGSAVMSLSTALLLTQMFTLVSNMIPLSEVPCVAFAAIMHYFWLATFTWSTILAGILVYQFVLKSMKQLDNSFKSFLWCQLVGWSVPLVLVAIALVFHFCGCLPSNMASVYDSSICWIRAGVVNLIAFGIPVAVCLAINIVLVSFTLIHLHKERKHLNELQSKAVDTGWREIIIFAKVGFWPGNFGFKLKIG